MITILCYAMLRYAITYYSTLYYTTLYYDILCYAILAHDLGLDVQRGDAEVREGAREVVLRHGPEGEPGHLPRERVLCRNCELNIILNKLQYHVQYKCLLTLHKHIHYKHKKNSNTRKGHTEHD